MTYEVVAKRWEHGWELHIDGVGVTQCEAIKDAEAMVRDYLDLEGLNRDAPIRFHYQIDDELDSEIVEIRQAVEQVARHPIR
ncbi:hypothetical protein LX16_2863 [Stackebrandtia albiflava]|uniref:Uncharacterized protein n=1 Tax=Stackebrandtia albiflava TaxID=406432 RepID=A0A562V2N2_9ACTN|nr:hypothetical protein [Stackebrandtia albiflava]TWJ12115.1 hypothetical protein LX16_2863 [Stackebrandtia albiflava]